MALARGRRWRLAAVVAASLVTGAESPSCTPFDAATADEADAAAATSPGSGPGGEGTTGDGGAPWTTQGCDRSLIDDALDGALDGSPWARSTDGATVQLGAQDGALVARVDGPDGHAYAWRRVLLDGARGYVMTARVTLVAVPTGPLDAQVGCAVYGRAFSDGGTNVALARFQINAQSLSLAVLERIAGDTVAPARILPLAATALATGAELELRIGVDARAPSSWESASIWGEIRGAASARVSTAGVSHHGPASEVEVRCGIVERDDGSGPLAVRIDHVTLVACR